MRWRRGGISSNVEDRRSRPSARRAGPGLRLPLPAGGRGRLGLGGVALVLLILWLGGGDLGSLLEVPGIPGDAELGLPGGAGEVGAQGGLRSTPEEEELAEFVSFVLDDLQATWARAEPGYRDAVLVLFRDAVESACGLGQAAMGPFYCPLDQRVYVDLGFYSDLRRRFGAPGDFAQAYVLAHEIGHHLQNLRGDAERVRRAQASRPERANELSVRMELQADCLAGVWAHSTGRRGLLEPGDIEEGLAAAAAVGDDRIQETSGGGVHPESFTHGTSAQRRSWFERGVEAGDAGACDTFEGA